MGKASGRVPAILRALIVAICVAVVAAAVPAVGATNAHRARQAASRARHFAGRRHRLRFPDSLGARPVEVTRGADSVGFRLLGASGHPVASGPTARFADALPHVSATYTAQPERVKENLTLA